MRVNEFITELFSPKGGLPLEWESNMGAVYANAIDHNTGKKIEVHFWQLPEGAVEIDFMVDESYQLTNRGDQFIVFATVVNAIKEYDERYAPKYLIFSAKESSRKSLYTKMVKRLAPTVGYKIGTIDVLPQEVHDSISLTPGDFVLIHNSTNEIVSEEVITAKYNNLLMKYAFNSASLVLKAFEPTTKNPLAYVKFVKENDDLYPQDLWVNDEYRSRGIAKSMYDYLKDQGYIINRSHDQTKAGSGFWDKHRGENEYVWEETITEGATDILYHYTTTANAARALRDGVFKLSNTAGNRSEQQYAPKGYPYFLSTTRSRVGDYHRYVGTGGVMFVLDGRWLASRYPVKPIDYWERSWQHSPDRSSESEDRVFSKENEMPLGGVTALHVLLKEQDEHRSPLTRGILINAKKLGIKTYLYTDENAWRLQDTRKAVAPSADLLKGQQSSGRFTRPVRGVAARRGGDAYGRSGLLDWIELIMKQPGQELSKSADKLRQNITYYGDTSGTLANDLFNAKKPDGPEYEVGVKLGNYMAKNKLDARTLADRLKDKWKRV